MTIFGKYTTHVRLAHLSRAAEYYYLCALDMPRKTALFFDLDHTIWDFDRNATETLLELVDTYQFHRLAAGRR